MGNSCKNSCKECTYYLCCCYPCCCCCEGKDSCIESLNTFYFDGCITNQTEDSICYQVLPPGKTSKIKKKLKPKKHLEEIKEEGEFLEQIKPQVIDKNQKSNEALVDKEDQQDDTKVQVRAGMSSTLNLENIAFVRSSRGFSKWPTLTVWRPKKDENEIFFQDQPIKSNEDITFTFSPQAGSIGWQNKT